jgi:hypothetical protein
MSDSKNDQAWEKLFNKYDIIDSIKNNGSFVIKSNSINEFREARLMTKFDYKSQLPKIFSDNDFSILPVTRGDYIISDMKTYQDFDTEDVEIKKINFPNYIESIDYKNISSEATALNCAYISNIITEFSGDEDLLPTVSGRMSSQTFDFKIDTMHSTLDIAVGNSQIEIDGGYEGINTLCLFEAKNSISNDFLVRQLYYPFRLWRDKIKKEVKTLFLTYSNGIFHIREYRFDDAYYYNSIRLIRQMKYVIRDGVINFETIQHTLYEVSVVNEPNIPFPQANSFERIINLCELLNDKINLSRSEITENYDFNSRQTNYYTDAGRYLGLIEKGSLEARGKYSLTTKGKALFDLSLMDRQIEFTKLILSHLVFKRVLELYLQKAEPPSKNDIVEIMKTSNLYNINSEDTFFRRASTILSWINWIINLIEE